MSPRAAWRLDSLGFEAVFDYVPGKSDWSAAGLPLAGDAAEEETAGRAADPSVPTCALSDDLQHVRARVCQTEWRQCIVVNDERIALGRLGRLALEQDDERTIEEAMAEGPSTVRPDEPFDKLLARLERQQLETALVTTSEGRLGGVVRRADGGR